MKLPVSEVFHTLQGEGPTLGVPSTFVRFAVCNLHCVWCDAWYTWQRPKYTEMTARELNAEIDRVTSPSTRQLVITGGEPMLWGDPINDWLEADPHEPSERGIYFERIEVETNGTIMPADGLWDKVSQWNVSPKLGANGRGTNTAGGNPDWPVKGDPLNRRINAKVLSEFVSNGNAFFKFVIAETKDVSELKELEADLGLPKDRILVMPEGITTEVLLERGRWLAEVCKDNGWRFTPRLQIELWGNKRGT